MQFEPLPNENVPAECSTHEHALGCGRAIAANEQGYVAILVALLVATIMLPLCAIAVDVARWYVEIERMQNAADAAALAGVTYLPGRPGLGESDRDHRRRTQRLPQLGHLHGHGRGGREADPAQGDDHQRCPQHLRRGVRQRHHHHQPVIRGRLQRTRSHGQPLQHVRKRASGRQRGTPRDREPDRATGRWRPVQHVPAVLGGNRRPGDGQAQRRRHHDAPLPEPGLRMHRHDQRPSSTRWATSTSCESRRLPSRSR